MKSKRLFSMQRSLIKFNIALVLCFIITAMFIFVLPNVAFAQTLAGQSQDNVNAFSQAAGIQTSASLVTIIGRIVQICLAVLGIVLILLIIYGGWIWMSSQGDPAKVEKAKKIITNAIIGVIIIALSFAIATFIMNALNGTVGRGGGGGSTIPGGPNDWNRSMIGRGPIESVYPAPNQKNVYIDTQIVVTFKEVIDPATVFDPVTHKMTDKIEICQVDPANYNCISTSTSGFGVSDYASTTASSTMDNKTFVFAPNKYLGLNDSVNRIFKVRLKNGINKANGESVFKGGYYEWVFETNGKLDLNPPKIVAADVYPVPDTEADSYDLIEKPSNGVLSVPFSTGDLVTDLPLRMGASSTTLKGFVGQALSVELDSTLGQIPPEHKLYLKTDSGFTFGGSSDPVEFVFTVNSAGTAVTVAGNYAALGLTAGTVQISGNTASFGNGLYVESNGSPFVHGSSWHFYLAGARSGGSFIINNNSSTIYRYRFVNSNETRTKITENGKEYFPVKIDSAGVPATVTNLVAKINETAGEVVVADSTGSNLTVKAKYAGDAGNNIRIGKTETGLQALTGGVSQSWGRSPSNGQKGAFDPYNNSVFQITFDKSINPISIANSIVVKYDSNGDGVINASDANSVVTASSSISNQYRTVTLKGPYECGKNSCGEKIYCWTNSNPSLPTSTKFSIEIAAAKLKVCSDTDKSWCGSSATDVGGNTVGFGGVCATGGRCSKDVGGKTVFYPKAGDALSGIADLSNNSFNGNFDSYSYTENGSNYTFGIAQGKSGDCTDGCSQMNPFVLTTSTPAANSTLGDNIGWSFYLSSEIDTASPLMKAVFPTGGKDFGLVEDEQSNQPVEAKFDRLMDSSTLKPGWGYSSDTSAKEWFERYLVLGTITTGANPIGYWVEKSDGDDNGDGWSDITTALISHNNFDTSVQYGPLAGSGARSITQNCFLPGAGPKYAGDTHISNSSNTCVYESRMGTTTSGCVSDIDLGNEQVVPTNPASYAHMKCTQIEGAKVCPDNKKCEPFYNTTSTNIAGSWVITLDHPTSTVGGRTGCCFGTCK